MLMQKRLSMLFPALVLACSLHAATPKNKAEAVSWGKKDEAVMRTFWYQAPRPVLTIPKTLAAPEIDGVADDSCWQNASAISFLTAIYGFAPKPPMRWGIDGVIARNEVRVCYDDSFLYVHFTCYERLMPMLQRKVETRDGSVWKDDCVEFFLDPGRTRNRDYHVIINPAAAVYDSLDALIKPWPDNDMPHPDDRRGMTKDDRTWNFQNVQAAVKIHDDRWELEVKFDFASVGGVPKLGDAWGMDFCRQRRASGIEGVWTYASWSGSPFGFSGNMVTRGDVVFGDLPKTSTGKIQKYVLREKTMEISP